jgi:hypothetical protein
MINKWKVTEYFGQYELRVLRPDLDKMGKNGVALVEPTLHPYYCFKSVIKSGDDYEMVL